MPEHFLDLVTTPAVAAAQIRDHGWAHAAQPDSAPDELSAVERDFIAARDSFYVASVTETGWPYIQHRGGPPGFLKTLGPRTLGFADLRGNRQMLTTGNVAASDRVSLFLMDYPQRSRLKILGRARVQLATENPELAATLAMPGQTGVVERLFTIDVVAFDWNCPKYITPRYTKAEVERVVAPLRARIAELEAQRLRGDSATDRDLAVLDQPLGLRARQLWNRARDNRIEASPGLRCGDDEFVRFAAFVVYQIFDLT